MAEEETDSEDDGGLPQEVAEIRNGPMQNQTGGIQPSSAHQMTGRQSGDPIDHSHEISEELDLSFKKNCELLVKNESAI